MSAFKYFLAAFFLTGSLAHAEGGKGFGINVGLGLPFLTQAGVDYVLNDKLRVGVGYNLLDLDVDEASLELSMPEVMVYYHPFSGSFFLGAGLGQETLEVTATESIGTDTVKIEVDAMTTILKTGWTWGSADGGFWYGFDIAYIMPSGADVTITAPAVLTTDPNYIDAVEAADDFGESAYPNVTFARLGYLF